jgi:molecular chaperone GrpE
MFGKEKQVTENNKEKQQENEFKNPNETEVKSDLDVEKANDTESAENDNQNAKKSDINNIEEKKKVDEKLQIVEENEKLKDTLMRTLAELENTRRRATEENDKTSKYAISKFAEELIPVMENFYLAFKDIGDTYDEKKTKIFLDGVKLTQSELKKVFEKNGLIRLFPIGETFNPDFHNAISQVESDKKDGTIVDVMQAGYSMKGRLLRPALVIISKGGK